MSPGQMPATSSHISDNCLKSKPLPTQAGLEDFALDQLLDAASALLALDAANADITADARRWTDRVAPLLADGSLDPALTLRLLPHFEALHIAAWQSPAPRTLLNRNYLRAFSARIEGNTQVDEELLFAAISRAINLRRDPDFMGKPLQWYALTIERWLDHPTPSRAALLSREDLALFRP